MARDLIEIADLARFLYTGYPDAARRFHEATNARDVADRYGFPAELCQSTQATVEAIASVLAEYRAELAHLAALAPLRLPNLWPSLRVVGDSLDWGAKTFDWGAAVAELRQIESEALRLAAGVNGGKTPRRRTRSRRAALPKPLTPRQAEVVHAVGEVGGNLAEAARRLGVDRKTVAQSYRAAMRKMGVAVVKHATKALPTDRRGGAAVAAGDDARRPGNSP